MRFSLGRCCGGTTHPPFVPGSVCPLGCTSSPGLLNLDQIDLCTGGLPNPYPGDVLTWVTLPLDLQSAAGVTEAFLGATLFSEPVTGYPDAHYYWIIVCYSYTYEIRKIYIRTSTPPTAPYMTIGIYSWLIDPTYAPLNTCSPFSLVTGADYAGACPNSMSLTG